MLSLFLSTEPWHSIRCAKTYFNEINFSDSQNLFKSYFFFFENFGLLEIKYFVFEKNDEEEKKFQMLYHKMLRFVSRIRE